MARLLFIVLIPVLFLPGLAQPLLPVIEGLEEISHEGRVLSEIRLEGNRRTRDLAILRELYLQPGLAFDIRLLQRDLRFLDSIGLFESVSAQVREEEDRLILTLLVRERGLSSMRQLYPNLDFDSRMRPRLSLIYRHRNLRGLREDLTLMKSQGWEEGMYLKLNRPWLGVQPLEHTFLYSHRDLDAEDRDEFRESWGSFSLWIPLDRSRPLDRRFLIQLLLGERYQEEGEDSWEESLNAASVGFSVDLRERMIRPDRGVSFLCVFSRFSPLIGSSHDLKKLILKGARYRRLPGGSVLAMKAELGLQSGDLYHRGSWGLGGIDAVRGWAQGEWSGWDAGAGGEPQGRNRFLARLEIRRDLFPRSCFQIWRVGKVLIEAESLLFVDAGVLWNRGMPWDTQSASATFSPGIGLRLFSPFGDVLRLEAGLNPEGGVRLHLGTRLP
ncbi:MAG: BamA/TamA family outer membrane protein [Candidatus Krumholzibacteria bacterium]|nr:BamA/TamA family outer membrane protein [Candidatus Krumholzibacteria bacterium]